MTTKDKILYVAEDMTQRLGVNGFSYRDIATEVDIKTSSIHYYFPTKDDLFLELINRYESKCKQYMAELLNPESPVKDRLNLLVTPFIDYLHDGNKLCLCVMIAGQMLEVSEPVKIAIKNFFEGEIASVSVLIQEGVSTGEFKNIDNVNATAVMLLSTIEGGAMLARATDNPAVLKTAYEAAVKTLR